MEIETRDDVTRLIVEALPEYADQITPHLQPAIRFNSILRPGYRPALQVGGGASLPPDVAWPEHEGRMMHLVAVVDLEQVSEVDTAGLLPRNGLLHFFYDAVAQKWGYDPSDVDSWHVVLVPEPQEDEERPLRFRPAYPGDEVYYYDPVLLEERFGWPYVQWTVPHSDEEELAGIEWERNERGGMPMSLVHRFALIDDEVSQHTHQMLGWPTVVQNPMRLQCQLVSNGLYCGDSSGYNSAAAETLRPGLYDWVLLLQLNSWGEYDNGGRWGSDGMLYFWIRRDDLRAARFDRVWMILRSP